MALNFSSHCRCVREDSAENPESTGSSPIVILRSGMNNQKKKKKKKKKARRFRGEPGEYRLVRDRNTAKRNEQQESKKQKQNDSARLHQSPLNGHGILPEAEQMQKTKTVVRQIRKSGILAGFFMRGVQNFVRNAQALDRPVI